MEYKTANRAYWERERKRRTRHYAGAYKGRMRAIGATGDAGPSLPPGVLPGSEAARAYMTGQW